LAVSWARSARTRPTRAAAYHLLGRIPIPGDGGYYDFLFVDEGARRGYVSWGTQVAVLDADKGAVVGTVDGFKKVHGIVMTPAGGFITDGGTGSVAKFDPKTLKVTTTVPAGNNPDAIMYDPAAKRVLAFNHSGKNATVIDPAAGKAVGTVELGGMPEVGRADGKGTVWVNLEDTSEVVRIDSKKMAVTARWKLAPCEEPDRPGVRWQETAACSSAVQQDDGGAGRGERQGGDHRADRPRRRRDRVRPGNGPRVQLVAAATTARWAWSSAPRPITYVALESGGDAAARQDAGRRLEDAQGVPVRPRASRPRPPGQKRGKMVPGSFTVLV
jgi:hypothetical protein